MVAIGIIAPCLNVSNLTQTPISFPLSFVGAESPSILTAVQNFPIIQIVPVKLVMGIISGWWSKVKTKQTANINPEQGGQIAPPKPKSLADLEAEVLAELDSQGVVQVHSTRDLPAKKKANWLKRTLITGIVMAIPVAIVAVANLPVAFIRQGVAQNAPVLLIPTYLALEQNFKNGIIALEEARQLIDKPTSIQDIERGHTKLQEAKECINSLPAWFISDWDTYYAYYRWYWYHDGRFTPAGFQQARREIGELEGKAFQETNALQALNQTLTGIAQAKSNYLQATSDTQKRLALQTWQLEVEKLALIPETTLAGRQAQQRMAMVRQELQTVAGSDRLSVAQEYSRRAADMGKNPPHTADKWLQIEQFWLQAIAELEKVPAQDLLNYQSAQKLTAEYKLQLAEVQRRLRAEEKGVKFYEQAQNKVNRLIANTKRMDRLQMIASLREILQDLDKVERGTTVYTQAQELKGYTDNFLKKVEAGTPLESIR